MRVCVFEDRGVDSLKPLTLTRPACDLLCGGSALLEHQLRYFGIEEYGLLVRSHLEAVRHVGQATPPAVAGKNPCLTIPVNDYDWLRCGPTVLVNSRWIPPVKPLKDLTNVAVGLVGKQIAFVVLSVDRLTYCSANTLHDCLETWKEALPQRDAGGVMIDYPWDLVQHNGEMLERDFAERIRRQERTYQPATVSIVGPTDLLVVHDAAVIEPMVLVDTTRGPVIVERDALVQSFSRLEGPCYVGAKSRVLGGRIRAGTTIGPDCRVGGEVEASILHAHVNKYHDGFVGHSYVGEWVNLAAGTQTGDLRNDYEPIAVEVLGWNVNSGLAKVGSFIGDHTRTGLNTLLNAGSTIGVFCHLLPTAGYAPRVVPSFCRHQGGRLLEEDLSKLLSTALRAMGRRGEQLSEVREALYRKLHELTADERQVAIGKAEQRLARRSA